MTDLSHMRELTPGRPLVYKTTHGTWASVTWTRDPAGDRTVPQANANHRTWRAAIERVRRWYEHGKDGTY